MLRLGKVTQHAKNLRLRQEVASSRLNSTLDVPPPIQRSFSTLYVNMQQNQPNEENHQSSSPSSLTSTRPLSLDPTTTKLNYLKLKKLLDYSLEQQANPTNSWTALSRYFKPKQTREHDATQSLYKRQLALEERQREKAELEHREQISNLKVIGRGTSIKSIQRNILSWYEPLTKALIKERQAVLEGVKSEDRFNYGPYFILVPVEKMAVIVLDTIVSEILRNGNTGITSLRMMLNLGSLLETEVKINRIKQSTDETLIWARSFVEEKSRKNVRSLRTYARIRKLLKQQDVDWSSDLKIKLGSVLLKAVLCTAKTKNGEAAFQFMHVYNFTAKKKQGFIKMSAPLFAELEDSFIGFVFPQYLPMLIPPKPWMNHEYNGAYHLLKAPLLKYTSRKQVEVLKKSRMDPVLRGLDYLGTIPWRVNEHMLHIIEQVQERGLLIGEMVSQQDMPLPDREAFQAELRANPDLIYRKRGMILDPINRPEEFQLYIDITYRQACNKISKKNQELHSLRCDMAIRMAVAKEFISDSFYFPHNLDFRGRAYPIPPNLNHLGADLSRSLLLFDEGRVLGETGLRWLKIHIANLCGYNKVSFDDRAKWTEDLMPKILASARNPFEEMWWSTSECPFQTLACCREIANAMSLDDPTQYVSHLPIHQDGSCNGLQHYASLGRDYSGGQAVNLVNSDAPQDVYSRVLDVVLRRIQKDCIETPLKDKMSPSDFFKHEKAKRVLPIVNRKVIKQTVMTSVYGVTHMGARAQIEARLYEAFNKDSALITREEEKELYELSDYVATVTLSSLREVFNNAKRIMDWLSEVAREVAKKGHGMSWVTPLGLPVYQAYRTSRVYHIRTVLQSVTLAESTDDLPISPQKQKSAFPPNFVHSLDASHMLMTSLNMKDRGLSFAAVHDSYWTHACDVDTMREALRESFVELYEQPILEDLRATIIMRFPDIDIPPVPERGELNLKDVLDSQYFFH